MPVFALPAGATLPILTDVLRDDTGNPINLSGATVALTLTNLEPPYEEITPVGIAAVTSAAAGAVKWTPDVADTTDPFVAAVRWEITSIAGVQCVTGSVTAFRVDATDDTPPLQPLCSPSDVETQLRRPLTPAEWAAAITMIEQVTGQLELWLNRDLRPRRRTEVHTIGQTGVLSPDKGPFRRMVSITFDSGDASTAYNDTWAQTRFIPGTVVTIVYDSGDVEAPTGVLGVITESVAAPIAAGVMAGTGAVTNYSVEGTSITYGAAATGAGARGVGTGVGRLTVGSINAVRALRRGVMVW